MVSSKSAGVKLTRNEEDDNDGIVELFGHLELYANEGVTWSGKIPLRGFQRVCEVHLSTLKNRNNVVALKFNENI